MSTATTIKPGLGRVMRKTIDPEVFRLTASLCGALANEKRIEIVYYLSTGPQSATELREKTGLSKSSLSQHMGILVTRGIAKAIPNGKFVQYEIGGAKVTEVHDLITKLCREHLDQMRKLASQF